MGNDNLSEDKYFFEDDEGLALLGGNLGSFKRPIRNQRTCRARAQRLL